jgi:DNA repair protein RadC
MKRRDLFDAWIAAEQEGGMDRRVRFPADVIPHVAHLRKKRQEHFLVVTLNGAHEIIRVRTVTKGTVNRSLVHPREIFIGAIRDHAAAVMVVHNHPSGNLEPSPEDREVTSRLMTAGNLLGLRLLDHVIVSKNGYWSFLEQGEL